MNRRNWAITVLVLAIPLGLWFGWRSHSTSSRERSSPAEEVRALRNPIGRPMSSAAEPRSVRLVGQVIGIDGAGVGGAEVSLSGASRAVRSAADGTFSFEALDAAEYVIRATAGDLTSGPVPVRAPGDPVLVRLDLGAALVVHVVEDSGKPVVDAEVGLLDDPSRLVTTDGAGLATLRGVRAGRVGVTVSAEGFATIEVAADAAPGKTVEISVTLRQGYAVSGTVIDGRGRPVARAQVSVRGLWGAGIRGVQAVTDAEGRFTVAALTVGTHTLIAGDGEHAPAEAAPVKIIDRPIAGVTITLNDGGVIDGLVTRSDSAPAPAATVQIVGRGPSPVRELRTDENGRFQARGLPRGLVHLQAASDDATSDVVDVDLASADRLEARLTLDAAESIAGVVVDPKGRPVAGAQVNAYPDAADEASRPYGISRAATTTTERGGAFSIRGLHPGRYRLVATGAPGLRNPTERGVAAAAGDSDVRIALVAGGALRGRLRSSKDGASPPHAELQLGQRSPVSIEGGAIDLANIPPGIYDLTIRCVDVAELVRRGVAIRAGETTDLGTIELSAGRTLVGKVVDGRGAPVEGARIELGGSSQVTMSDRDGQFTLRGLPAAATSVAARDPGRGGSIAQAIAEGTADPAPVVLVLRGFGSVSGTVATPDPEDTRTMITMMPKDGQGPPLSAPVTDDGRFRFAEVPEGEYAVSAFQTQLGSTRIATAITAVAAGAETKVALDFPRGPITLSVQVEPPRGGAAAGATVFLFRGGVAASTMTELMQVTAGGKLAGMKPWRADGESPTFEELTPDSYSVCAVAAGGSFTTSGTTRPADRPTGLVACRRVDVVAAPSKQTVSCQLPSGG